jgi:toxin CcdB
MARFDVLKFGPNLLVLDVQTELLASLQSRVVVPLRPVSHLPSEPLPRLRPSLRILGDTYLLGTPEIGAVPVSQLGECVANLEDQREVIVDAIDFLLQGF